MDKLTGVGIIGGPHGHWGILKIMPLNGMLSEIKPSNKVYLINGDDEIFSLAIKKIKKYSRGGYLVRFCEFRRRSQVENFKRFILAIKS